MDFWRQIDMARRDSDVLREKFLSVDEAAIIGLETLEATAAIPQAIALISPEKGEAVSSTVDMPLAKSRVALMPRAHLARRRSLRQCTRLGLAPFGPQPCRNKSLPLPVPRQRSSRTISPRRSQRHGYRVHCNRQDRLRCRPNTDGFGTAPRRRTSKPAFPQRPSAKPECPYPELQSLRQSRPCRLTRIGDYPAPLRQPATVSEIFLALRQREYPETPVARESPCPGASRR